jgi:hypothetical protein
MEGIADEMDRAWPHMRPGAIQAADGTRIEGRSPSGALRGDRYILSRTIENGVGSWPAIIAADDMLGDVTSAVAAQLKRARMLELEKRSDTFVASFPGDGKGYAAHLDGDHKCKLTAILYICKWTEADGGCLHLLDEAAKCWWSVAPQENTLVLFRSDLMLHKVLPCFGKRHALTVFCSLGRDDSDIARERAALVALMSSYM